MRLSIDWRLSALLTAVAWVVMFTVCTLDAEAAEPWTVDDTVAAVGAARYERTRCIVYWETGGTYDPYAVGAAGELGAAQLHPRGLLPDFYAQGWGDPFNPYEATIYLDQALERGLARHWSPVLLGWC